MSSSSSSYDENDINVVLRSLHIPIEEIELATNNFADENLLKQSDNCMVYKGQILQSGELIDIVARKSHNSWMIINEASWSNFFNHKNIASPLKASVSLDIDVIINKYEVNGTLKEHLSGPTLTWMQRLHICVGVARALKHLHYDSFDTAYLIHGRLKSSRILLDHNWEPKLAGLGYTFKCDKHHTQPVDTYRGSPEYMDPAYPETRILNHKSDIFSFGVVLFEVLFSIEASIENNDNKWYFAQLARSHYENKTLDDLIDSDLRTQINLQSLEVFAETAYYCLMETRTARLDTLQVLLGLEKALKLQHKHEHPIVTSTVEGTSTSNHLKEDYETWEPKLPVDYKEIIQMSKDLEINNSTTMKKVLYDMFSKGILLHDDKVLFSYGSNGERNEMISATMFSYKSPLEYNFICDPNSRFQKVAEMRVITKMKTQIRITPRYLSAGVKYGAFLILKIGAFRKRSSKPIYVNLKYKKGKDNFHAYFAKWRHDEWMMIELWRFLSDEKEKTFFAVILESLSKFYCGKSLIHVEGIEFRVIDNVKNEEILKSNSNKDQLSPPKEVKHLMLSPMEVLYDSSNVKHLNSQPSAELRFQEVIELLPPQDTFCINYKIQSQMLSQDTEYLCYLVFKLSEKCVGLHCPVRVRDLVNRDKKEAKFIYFRSQSPWNIHENNSVPEQREDGLMEVKVWKFHSRHQLKNDCIRVYLKLITYEGTMSGLIVCGLECRPV